MTVAPCPRPRSGKHPPPTAEERADAAALVGQLRALICPEMPDTVPLARIERMLELPRQALQRCVVARGEAQRRMSPTVRAVVEAEILRRAPRPTRPRRTS